MASRRLTSPGSRSNCSQPPTIHPPIHDSFLHDFLLNPSHILPFLSLPLPTEHHRHRPPPNRTPALVGGEEGTRAARLHSFFASVLSGIFGQGDEEEEVEQEEMATHNQNAAAAAQLQNRGGVAALGKQKAVEISSGFDVSQKQSEGSASSVRKCSRKKVINTLTSVLTARSKVACGITDKPREVIEDIDKLDGDNQLAVVDYVEDIYKFYKIAENECRSCDYIDSQVEIISKMRAILADWIIEVHHKFELMLETLYLTMYIIDRYLSMQPML